MPPEIEIPKEKVSEALWTHLVTDDGAFVVDLQQQVLCWSPGAQRLTGYCPEEVLGKRCYQVVSGLDARNHRFCRPDCPVIVNARRGRPTPNYDILCTTSSGDERWLNVSIVLLKETRGTSCVLHLFRDVSLRRQTEDSARRVAATLREIRREGQGASPAVGLQPPPSPVPLLSPREIQVLRLLASGMTTQEIAEALFIRPVTARNLINRLLTKLGVKNRLQAVVYASQRGLI